MPTDGPEADGTLAWDSTTMVAVEVSAVLALLWLGLAWVLRRVRAMRMADAVAIVGLLALVAMAGPLPVLATVLLAAGAMAIGSLFVRDAALAFVVAPLVAVVWYSNWSCWNFAWVSEYLEPNFIEPAMRSPTNFFSQSIFAWYIDSCRSSGSTLRLPR